LEYLQVHFACSSCELLVCKQLFKVLWCVLLLVFVTAGRRVLNIVFWNVLDGCTQSATSVAAFSNSIAALRETKICSGNLLGKDYTSFGNFQLWQVNYR